MKSFFLWLSLQILVWGVLVYPFFMELSNHIWRLLGVTAYFVLLFITPLFRNKDAYLFAIFFMEIILITITFLPTVSYDLNLIVLLVFSLVMAEATEKLAEKPLGIVYLFSVLSIIGLHVIGRVSTSEIIFSVLFTIMVMTGFVIYKMKYRNYQHVVRKYENLSLEFRQLRRRMTDEEEAVRQEERHMIGQEIHDSVGHQLTSLIMQLEAYRLQADEKDADKVAQLKQLANQSLEETRRAVKTFKQREIGGLQGVLRLIRKLELESYIRIHFSVNHGAFAAPLTGEQSFTIYRAVQEGLTNTMKHSQTREVQLTFDAPGRSIFRFEMVNPITEKRSFKEGYGLTSMRERLEKLGGGLETIHRDKQFILRGWVRLK